MNSHDVSSSAVTRTRGGSAAASACGEVALLSIRRPETHSSVSVPGHSGRLRTCGG